MGIEGILAHARSASTAQIILGSSCARVELALDVAVDEDDDRDREILVAAWCVHPSLIPEEKMFAIPKPTAPHVVETPLYLSEGEIIHAELPALQYLARLRVIEFQD